MENTSGIYFHLTVGVLYWFSFLISVFFPFYLISLCVCVRAKGQHWQAHSDARGHVLRQQSLPGKTCSHSSNSLWQTAMQSQELSLFLSCCGSRNSVPLLLGTLQTPRSAGPRRPGIGRPLLGLHLRPRQPALDEVQWHKHHRVIMGGAGARFIRGHDQCKCLLPDVYRWQAPPPYYRCAAVRFSAVPLNFIWLVNLK